MSEKGLIGYETLIEHHKEHHKTEDALQAERDLLRQKLEAAIKILHQVDGMYVGYRGIIIDALKIMDAE